MIPVVRTFWVSCNKFTIRVRVEGQVITDAAPIAKRFIGQPASNLKHWMQSLGGYHAKEITQ